MLHQKMQLYKKKKKKIKISCIKKCYFTKKKFLVSKNAILQKKKIKNIKISCFKKNAILQDKRF